MRMSLNNWDNTFCDYINFVYHTYSIVNSAVSCGKNIRFAELFGIIVCFA